MNVAAKAIRTIVGLGVFTISATFSESVFGANDFYVATNGSDSNPGTLAQPFLTIEKARQVVRAQNSSMTGNITVTIRAGEYFLPSTLNLDQLDSGTNGFDIIYKAYPGERPIISGGQTIPNWTLVGGGIYKASVPSGLSGGFRQLYVNGNRAVRARTPNAPGYNALTSWDENNKTILAPKSEASVLPTTASALNKVEMVIQTYGGVDCKLRISSVTTSGNTSTLTPLEPERTRVFAQFPYPPRNPNRPYHFENAYSFLDTEGEWFLDTTTNEVFYKPFSYENMATAEVRAPKLETILGVQGSANSNVHNIQFSGLTFEGATWLEPNAQGYITDQSCAVWHSNVPLGPDQVTDYHWAIGMPAGIHVEYANNLRFERNVIRHFGGSGINLFRGDSYNTLIGNVVSDISGSGICVDLNLEGYLPDNSPKLSPHNTINNNVVARVGRDYYGAAGIFASYTDSSTIEHNELFDMPSIGITVGWGWADVANAAKNNMVRFNEVYDAMDLIADGGGIYTLSRQPGTRIEENYLHEIFASASGGPPNNGMFFDEGSNQITAIGNVCVNIPQGCIRFNTNPSGITNTNNGGQSPTTIANAGLESAYEDILQYVTPPQPLPGVSPSPTPTPTPSPTPSPTPTPTPPATPTPSPVSISGSIFYCLHPLPGPVPNVTLSLTGSGSGSTLSNSSGNYQFSLAPSGTYVVTPAKTALLPGSASEINTLDMIATQRHFTSCGSQPGQCLSGCSLAAADVNGNGAVNTVDVIAIQRFFLGLSTGTANVGTYDFSPVSRSYPGAVTNQTDQNYDALVFGDVTSDFVE